MLKRVLIGLVTVGLVSYAIYIGLAWYNTDRLGPGEDSPDWAQTDMIDMASAAATGAPALTRILANPQGLDTDDYNGFVHADQGSLLLPYDIFVNLEMAGDRTLFTAPENLLQLRMLPARKDAANPDGLPIGIARTERTWQGETYAGLTCAACHSGLITYQGTGLYVIGAPTQMDFQTMTERLSAAATAALDMPDKFDRLAERIGVSGDDAREELRTRLAREEGLLSRRIAMNASSLRYGNGRVDAVGQIYNAATSVNLNLPQNATAPDAPVSYPQIWGTGQADVAQWTGFAPNDIIGSILLRNAGEVIGVFGRVEIKPGAVTYPSSVNVAELGELEEWVNQMEPPAWPEDVLGKIDRDLAAEGQGLYARHCSGCHEIKSTYQDYKAALISPDELGVDPLAARKTLETGETRSGGQEPKLKMLITQTFGVILDQPEAAIKAIADEAILDEFGKRGGYTYKARTLNGIWATAPYLHNGSVPTLYDLLSPPDERPALLRLGGWEFDPEKVGMAAYDGPDAFVLDTALPGNRNTGHDSRIFETTFTEAERWALVEYLKTL